MSNFNTEDMGLSIKKKKKDNKPEWTGNPNEKDLKKIKGAIISCEEYFNQIANAKENIKDVFDDINLQTGIPRRTFNFIAKSYFDGKGREKIQQNDDIKDLYETLESVEI